MNKINFSFLLLAGIVCLVCLESCHKPTVGFLLTEQASYQVDTLVAKSMLDTTAPQIVPNPQYEQGIALGYPPDYLAYYGIYPTIAVGGGADYARYKRNEPWTSLAIEGVQGTQPIMVKISALENESGKINPEWLKNVAVRGNGIFTIPLDHQLPVGRYRVSLSFTNEGYSKTLDNVFTIIIN